MTAERARRGKLAKAMPDHVLGHVNLQEHTAIVHVESVPDELGDDDCRTRPGLDRILGALLVLGLDFFISFSLMYGPFLMLRLMSLDLLVTTRCPPRRACPAAGDAE